MNKAGSFIDREVGLAERTTRGLLSEDELVAPLVRESMVELLRGSSNLRQTITSPALAGVEPADHAPLASARKLIKRGIALWRQGRSADALDAFDQVAERFGDSKLPELLGNVATALVNKGVILCELNRLEEALVAHDEVLERFNDSEESALLELVADAIVSKGAVLIGLKRPDEALVACDDVLRRFGESEAPELLAPVANALVNKGIALGALDRSEEALAVYDEMQRRFNDTDVPELLEPVASALVRKSVLLGTLGRLEEALAVSEEALRRFDYGDAPELVEEVANALMAKGIALSALCRPEEALVACDEVLRRFGETKTTWSRQRVAHVLVNKSIVLAELGGSQSRDIVALLSILPDLGSPQVAKGVLLAFSIDHGPKLMRELIQGSPAAELLQPLTTALEREMGLEPRVTEEVSTMAKDIQRDLAKMRKTRRAAVALSSLQREAVRRGLDQLTMDEIDKEIQAFRRGRKDG